jgi:hypothetical protein
VRTNAWDALLKARAIENMSFSIGVNRLGTDANGYEYIGLQAVDYLGNYVLEPESEGSFIVLDKQAMLETRQKLGFLNDRDVLKFSWIILFTFCIFLFWVRADTVYSNQNLIDVPIGSNIDFRKIDNLCLKFL